MLNLIIQFLLLPFPWVIRRWMLIHLFNYSIAQNAKINKSIILAKDVILEEYARIGSGTICKAINKLHLKKNASIGNFCMITGIPVRKGNLHYLHIKNRKCELVVGEETAITSRHYFDCTAGIYIGCFSEIAGHGSTFLTHSIDIKACRQDASSISIGNYCFIGLKATILKGVTISDKIAIGACSLVTKSLDQQESLYGGQPAKFIKPLLNYKFFERKIGYIY